MIENELSAFFAPGDFSRECTRKRVATSDVVFSGIFSDADEVVLDGHFLDAHPTLLYPTEAVDLSSGDLVQVDAKTYKVQSVGRHNDGLESIATLTLTA